MRTHIIIMSVLLFVLQACTPGGGPCSGVSFTFSDSHLAPEYRRNYQIDVAEQKLDFVVDNGEDELYQTTINLSEQQFKEITNLCSQPAAGFNGKDKWASCNGCKYKSLVYHNAQRTSLDWTEGEVGEPVQALIDALQKAIPDFEKHISDTVEE